MTGFEPATAASSAPMALSFNTTLDVIEWLPEGAADRLRALRQRSADLNQIIPKSEDRLAASAARVEAEQRLARLGGHQSQRGGGFNLKPDDPRVIEQQRLLDKLTADAKRINDLYEVRAASYREATQSLYAVEARLKGRPGTFADHNGEVPKLNKGESLMDAIERTRRRGRELKADLHRIKSAPFPASYAKRRAREQVEELAARGAINVSRLVEHDGPVEFPMQMLRVPIHNAQGALGSRSDRHARAALLDVQGCAAEADRCRDRERERRC